MAPPPAKGNPLNGHEQRANGVEDIRWSIDAFSSMPDRILYFRAEKGPAYPVSST